MKKVVHAVDLYHLAKLVNLTYEKNGMLRTKSP